MSTYDVVKRLIREDLPKLTARRTRRKAARMHRAANRWLRKYGTLPGLRRPVGGAL